MAAETSIEWTDATWNPVRGCTKISPGCKHCYAETFAERFRGVPGHPYEQGFDLRLVPDALEKPLHWRKPRMVFVNSMSDLFHEGVPFGFIEEAFAVMANASWHTFQVLTKRADRMREFFEHLGPFGQNVRAQSFMARRPDAYRWPLPNVWLGVSVEDQKHAAKRIPDLLATPAAVRFLSVEPLLGPVSLTPFIEQWASAALKALKAGESLPPRFHWVIAGGESGRRARPCAIEWIASIVRECRTAGVPVFVKQLGALPVVDEATWRSGELTPLLQASSARKAPPGTVPLLYTRKGGDPAEWPVALRVREFPRRGAR